MYSERTPSYIWYETLTQACNEMNKIKCKHLQISFKQLFFVSMNKVSHYKINEDKFRFDWDFRKKFEKIKKSPINGFH
jgi:hypothetical protein